MKLKPILVAAALATAAAGAFAADQFIVLTDIGDSAFGNVYEATFNQTVASAGDVLASGDDLVTFTGADAGLYNVVLNGSAQFVQSLLGTLNGQAVTVTPVGTTFSIFTTINTLSPDFSLFLSGVALAGAQYSGNISVSAIPEPETYALMLAGLGLMGFIARRRRPQQ